ncbi:AraC family transcriptional regulator [Sphingomonas aracearum]|uniref:AraC family transcriptional regulator n=1 Tax=Sphingomonas aracearum TaxID=2283317 RepID=A0A369VU32_9SPHN|nr:AraC family transcriptional regulator [Sphingomonas aracearum]RDE05593.1 AraC family transcriptional regulator [Sphingomonas aracearum]
MDDDPLSEVLALVKPRFSVAAALDAGGRWSIQFPGENQIRLQAVMSGDCWLEADDLAQPIRLNAGDCFLSVAGRFRLAGDLAAPSVPAYPIFAAKRGGVAVHQGGGAFLGLGCLFALDDAHARLLAELLPRTMLIESARAQARLRTLLDRMFEEARTPRPGSRLAMQHLSQMILIEALRLHMADDMAPATGWLAAFRDRRLAPVLAAVHHRPDHRWTLQALAACAGMSRTSFAACFREMVGLAPIEYLTRWRMLRAADALRTGSDSVAEIARAAGYASESAFGVAFKRVMGRSPRRGI